MKEKLTELYEMYRFRLERETGKCLAFSYRMGAFRNIEIVKLKNTADCDREAEELAQNYRAAGWGNMNIVFHASVEEAEKKLFEAFFYIEESRQRLREEYKDFCRLQTDRLKNPYSYIECKYSSVDEVALTGLVNHVVENVKNSAGRLTILEAAAGFGKTCTVYEILHQMLDQYPDRLPLFIELSKNRTASIFLYVLQNEINDKFTQLSSELVIREIKKGKIPLIIDGFDELIQWKKSVDQKENPDEQSLSMLSTIADLLGEDSHAWILMTSRRSAIFTGDIFEEWVGERLGRKCEVERLQILKPSTQEWIGEEKYDCLRENRISIESISNPVLLTFIRNESLEKVRNLAESEDAILSKYFMLLLEREKERQTMTLSVEEMYGIMERLASLFVQYDIKAESRDFIQDLLYELLAEKMMDYRTVYRQEHGNEIGMLSNEEYIERILINSLLDRVSMTSNQMGFVNEFVLGVLVGDAVCDGLLLPESSDIPENFIDISTTAFLARGFGKRQKYYDRIKAHLDTVTGVCRLNAEMNLLYKNGSDYREEYFNGVYFPDFYRFDSQHIFYNCVFSECIFDHCEIEGETFKNVKFFNCQFYDVKVMGQVKDCIFLGGYGYEQLKQTEPETQVKEEEPIDRYEKIVLEQFWKTGYNRAELRRTYTALFKGVDPKDHCKIESALKSLLRKKLLRELNVCFEINMDKIDEIIKMLGRTADFSAEIKGK